MASRKLISVSIPVLNESENIDALYQRLNALASSLKQKYEFEFIFTDNQSDDLTWDMICALAKKDKRVKGYRFTHNIGFQKSILMNYSLTAGEAVVQIDADLQDPPELIEEFLAAWEQGAKVVYGVRRSRREGPFDGFIRRLGYWAMDKMSEHPIPQNAGDFRLIDRKVVNILVSQNNPRPYLRGAIAALRFNSVGIPYDRSARETGVSKFPMGKVIRLGIVGIFENSLVPLKMASVLGLVFLVSSIAVIVWTIISRLLDPSWPAGFASLFSLMLFGFGVNSMLIGIIGQYLLRTYLAVRAEPLGYIADSTVPV